MSGIGKSSADIALIEGETAPIPGRTASVRLDRFETEYYPGGGVKDWTSTVTVLENGVPAAPRKIEVNHPLSWKGTVLYQSSYGWDWERPEIGLRIRRKSDPAFLKRARPRAGRVRRGRGRDDRRGAQIRPRPRRRRRGTRWKRARPSRTIPPSSSRAGRTGTSSIPAGSSPVIPRSRASARTGPRTSCSSSRGTRPLNSRSSRRPGTPEPRSSGSAAPSCWRASSSASIGLPREVRIALEARDGDAVSVAAGGLASKGREDFEREFAGLTAALRRVP